MAMKLSIVTIPIQSGLTIFPAIWSLDWWSVFASFWIFGLDSDWYQVQWFSRCGLHFQTIQDPNLAICMWVLYVNILFVSDSPFQLSIDKAFESRTCWHVCFPICQGRFLKNTKRIGHTHTHMIIWICLNVLAMRSRSPMYIARIAAYSYTQL